MYNNNILPWICVWFHSGWVDHSPGTSPVDCWPPRSGRIRQTTSRPESERSKEYRTNKDYCDSSTIPFTWMLVELVDVFIWISTHKQTKKILHYTGCRFDFPEDKWHTLVRAFSMIGSWAAVIFLSNWAAVSDPRHWCIFFFAPRQKAIIFVHFWEKCNFFNMQVKEIWF